MILRNGMIILLILKSVFYPKLAMWRLSFDFRFAALLGWMMLVLASLSSIFCTVGYIFRASSLFVIARSLRTALRIVFA